MADKYTFGKFVREQRCNLDMTLRNFCKKNGLNCVILSKIERDIQVPKKTELRRFAEALKLLEGTAEYNEFLSLYEQFNPGVYEFSCQDLPVFLPPDITEENVNKLIDSVKEDHAPEEKDMFV